MLTSWRGCTEDYQDNWESRAHYLQDEVQGAHTSHSWKGGQGRSWALLSPTWRKTTEVMEPRSLPQWQEYNSRWQPGMGYSDWTMGWISALAGQLNRRTGESTAVDPPSLEAFTPGRVKHSWPDPDILMLTKVLLQAGNWTRWLQSFLTTSIARIPL